MALIGSVIFNTVFYLSLIPVSISIIILYFFLSTKKLQAFGSLWIGFVLWMLRIMCGVTWIVEVEPRREFIDANALSVTDLDI